MAGAPAAASLLLPPAPPPPVHVVPVGGWAGGAGEAGGPGLGPLLRVLRVACHLRRDHQVAPQALQQLGRWRVRLGSARGWCRGHVEGGRGRGWGRRWPQQALAPAGPRRPVAAWPRALGSALPRSPPPGVSWRLGLAPGAARGASEWRSRAGPPGGLGALDGPWVGTVGRASGTPPGTPSLCGGHLRPPGCPPAALSLLDPRWTPAGRWEEAGRAEARPAEQALLSFIPGSKLGSLGVEEGCQGTE